MEEPFQGADWAVRLRATVERSGRMVLDQERLELLEAIDRCHSISGAARDRGISYRHAWMLVQGVNEAAGELLVTAATGGVQGGGARLTPAGQRAVAAFRRLQDQLGQTAASLLPRIAPTAAIHVAAAGSLEGVLGQLLIDYAQQQGQATIPVHVVHGSSDELAAHILAGAPADLFIAADEQPLRTLEAAGRVEPNSATVLVANRLAAIGLAGRPAPVGKCADLSDPTLARVAVAGPASPLGRYTRAYLKKSSLYDALMPRALETDGALGVVAALRAGQVDIGLGYASDPVTVPNCRLLFQVGGPGIRYTAAVIRRVGQPEGVWDLLRFLQTRPAADRFRRCGFLPLGNKAN